MNVDELFSAVNLRTIKTVPAQPLARLVRANTPLAMAAYLMNEGRVRENLTFRVCRVHENRADVVIRYTRHTAGGRVFSCEIINDANELMQSHFGWRTAVAWSIKAVRNATRRATR